MLGILLLLGGSYIIKRSSGGSGFVTGIICLIAGGFCVLQFFFAEDE